MSLSMDSDAYLAEMQQLVRDAIERWRSAGANARIYSVSIWTDPDARASSVSVDTRKNAERVVTEANEWSKKHYDRLMAEGKTEEAGLFLPREGRPTNPADFEFRDLATTEHESFPKQWEECSDGACWDALESALKQIGAWAANEFGGLPCEPEAELGVNSRRDWYDARWRIAPAA